MATKKLYVYVSINPEADATAYRRPSAAGSESKDLLKGFCVEDHGLKASLEKSNERTPVSGKTGNQVSLIYGYPKGLTPDQFDLFEPDSVFLSAGTINFFSLEDANRFFGQGLTRAKMDYKP
jgi:hypothetical protein